MSSPIEVRQVIDLAYPDKSTIQRWSYRSDPLAPWIDGPFETKCGECAETIGCDSLVEAKLWYVEHILGHIYPELIELRRKFNANNYYRARADSAIQPG